MEEAYADNQHENSKVPKQLRDFQYKKGQSGNIEGRPKGKTLKEYCRDFLACQSEEERQEFLNGMDKETIWKMAEGSPETKTDITSKGERLIVIPAELINKNDSTSQSVDNCERQA